MQSLHWKKDYSTFMCAYTCNRSKDKNQFEAQNRWCWSWLEFLSVRPLIQCFVVHTAHRQLHVNHETHSRNCNNLHLKNMWRKARIKIDGLPKQKEGKTQLETCINALNTFNNEKYRNFQTYKSNPKNKLTCWISHWRFSNKIMLKRCSRASNDTINILKKNLYISLFQGNE